MKYQSVLLRVRSKITADLIDTTYIEFFFKFFVEIFCSELTLTILLMTSMKNKTQGKTGGFVSERCVY